MSYKGLNTYLELNQNSTQSVSANTITPVQYPNSVFNTFGSNLTLANTNSKFTNASGGNMFVIISASAVEDTGSANQGHAGWFFVRKNGVNTSTTTICQTVPDGNFGPTSGPFSLAQPLFLANTDYFEIVFISNVAMTLGNGTNIQTTGVNFRTSLVVLQLPGI